jgi:hypothetical protein
MAQKASQLRGRRAAPIHSQANSAHVPSLSFGGDIKRSTTLPDGEYNLTVIGARILQNKAGNVSLILNAETHEGEPVRLQGLLVYSPGGESQMVIDNRAILADMARLDGETVDADTLIAKLTGVTIWVDLIEVEAKDGSPANRILDGGRVDS